MRHQNLIGAIAVIAAASLARAQDVIPKAAPQSRPIAIEGATLHTVSGDVIRAGRLVFDGGVITSVGSAGQGAVVRDAEIIDGAGLHVFPGFICVASAMGLTEVGSVDMTIDTREGGDLKPEVRAAVAVNADSWHIPVARRNGILTCGVFPQGGLVSGRASIVRMDAWNWEEMALEQDAGLVINWPFMGATPSRFGRGGGRGRRGGGDDRPTSERQLAVLDELFQTAAAYRDARAADPSIKTDLRLDAMLPVIRGERPLLINAATRLQIESAVRWAVSRGLQPVIIGGRDARQCADLLIRHDVAVAITSSHRLPHRRDLDFAEPYELPGELERAGVRWCMTMPPSGAANVRNLPYEAAACIAHGLPEDVALRSITLAAADCLGVADRLGSLEVGKQATLFLADGDPFEFTTKLRAAWIDGRRIVLEDKQTQLDQKYRERYRQLGLLKD